MSAEIWTLTCAACGTEFQRLARKERYRLKHDRLAGPYCGRSCTGRSTAASNVAEWREGHARELVAMTCAECGRGFERTSDTAGERVFCSQRCSLATARRAKWPDALTRLHQYSREGATVEGLEGPCWEWTGALGPQGHAQIVVNGRRIGAHRFAFESHHGRAVAAGHVVHHRCFNPPCVNPGHLEEMTPSAHRKLHSALAKLER